MYLSAAVGPAKGASVALQASLLKTETMNVFLQMLGEEIKTGDHGIRIMGQAGWHKSCVLVVSANITVLYLPPHPPEFKPVEHL